MPITSFGSVSSCSFLLFAALNCAMANEQILHSFGTVVYSDGRWPQAGLVQSSDGTFYGTTTAGGTNEGGTVFKMNPDGSGYRLLHQFGSFAGDGVRPCSTIVLGQDGLYGVTSAGGTNGSGVVFRMSTDATFYSVIHDFAATSSLNYPSLLQGSDQVLYGTALGSAFRLNTDGSGFMLLRALPSQATPIPLLEGADGWLYGVASTGGLLDRGTIFKLTRDGASYGVIYYFDTPSTINDGSQPQVGVVQGPDSILYGTTAVGGQYGFGTIYETQPDGSGYHILFNFQGPDPATSLGLVYSSDGWLYGVYYGEPQGQVFRYAPKNGTFEILHDFDLTEGLPQSSLILATNGLLYGTTSLAVYQLSTDGKGFTVLHSFGTAYKDGINPQGTLTQTSDGTLYGTTLGGGTNSQGIVFQLGPDGTGYQLLHGFTGGTNDGASPSDGVVFAKGYGLFGLTSSGGMSNVGTLYRLDQDGGNYRVLHDFGTSPADGSYPQGRLLLGVDGEFYGTTAFGGTSNRGTLFRINPSGTDYQLLHMFGTEVPPVIRPGNSLVQDGTGALYGTTFAGGAYGGGTIFNLKPDGTEFQLLHSFPSVGNYEPAGLVLGRDGHLYGVFAFNQNGAGAVFRMAIDGSDFAIIKTLNSPTLGSATTLSQSPDGTLFGTSSGYFEGPLGFAFRLNTDGSGFGIIHFFAGRTGSTLYPYGALLPGEDGALYGSTGLGGAFDGGTVFRLTSVPVPPFVLGITPVAAGFHVSTTGMLGSTYYFETSTDLLNWYPTGVTSNETGLVEFFDSNKTNHAHRFYRMLQSP